MPIQAISELTPEPIENFRLTQSGEDFVVVCQLLHMPALIAHYGASNIPEPQAAVQDDGVLVFFWDMGGWPISMRLDAEQWYRR